MRHTILIVDDDAAVRDVLSDIVRAQGDEPLCAASGARGLELMATRDVHVVILDARLPDMHGADVLAQMVDQSSHVPVVMLTGYVSVRGAIDAIKQGAHEYMAKPFQVAHLIDVLDHAKAAYHERARHMQPAHTNDLYALSEQLSRAGAIEQVLDVLIEASRTQLDADMVAVWTFEDDTWTPARHWHRHDLTVAHVQGVNALNPGYLYGLNDASAQTYYDTEISPAQTQQGVLSPSALMCVPLRAADAKLGLLVVCRFKQGRFFQESERKFFSVLSHRVSGAMEREHLHGELRHTFKQTIQAFANLLEDKDPYTKGHSDRVSTYATLIARGCGMSAQEVEHVADCALLHDIGKLGIRYEDLNKVDPLSDAEYEMFKSHTTRGKWMLEPIAFLHDLIPGVYHHHERWDGKGYPVGLKGEDIPLVARILAIADTYDAMTSHRSYRRALPHDVAVREIQAFSGAQFDPRLVAIFVDAIAHDRVALASKKSRWSTLNESPPSVQKGTR